MTVAAEMLETEAKAQYEGPQQSKYLSALSKVSHRVNKAD
jgi:hypothetical protein